MLETLKFIIVLAYSLFAMVALAYMLIETIKTNIEYRQMKKKFKQEQERITKQIEEDNKLYRENLLRIIEEDRQLAKIKYKIEK